MERALTMAKYILNKCTVDKHMISNLQLQKIMYIIQREFLKNFHFAMIDCYFEAWRYGPVIPEVYVMYCGSGSGKINRVYDVELSALAQKYISKIDLIIETKRESNPWDLVDETHNPGGAWDITYDNGRGDRMIIKNELIESAG